VLGEAEDQTVDGAKPARRHHGELKLNTDGPELLNPRTLARFHRLLLRTFHQDTVLNVVETGGRTGSGRPLRVAWRPRLQKPNLYGLSLRWQRHWKIAVKRSEPHGITSSEQRRRRFPQKIKTWLDGNRTAKRGVQVGQEIAASSMREVRDEQEV
jgi:hypothetical protein